jgi:hypothetical protein
MPSEEELIPITKENIDIVLEFLPYFQNRSNIFYKEGLEHEPPIKVYDFLRALYEQKFTVEFPSYKRRKDIYSFVDRIIPISEANIGDIASIFKIILAGDRLTMGGGYLEDCIDNGLVLDLLKRLKEIRDKMD